MEVLLLSPFHGKSSHASWAEGYKKHSEHAVNCLTLPDRSWSWRLKNGSVPLAMAALDLETNFDIILATSLTCLSTFLALTRRSRMAGLPCVYYMHENQLTYPIRPGGKRDAQLVLRQFQSQLVADEVWFNSEHNRSSWFKQLPKFLRNFPDHQGLELLEKLEQKAKVVPVGLSLAEHPPMLDVDQKPLLLWNQRWEWEKGTDRFLALLKKFGPDVPFDVVLLGPDARPQDLLRQDLRELLGPRLLHEGWCEKTEYISWLSKATFTVSVARHEFFGISILEAAAHGCFTVLPQELSYPEIVPQELHEKCLYRSPKDLYRKIKAYLNSPLELQATRASLQKTAYTYCWRNLAERYDQELQALSHGA